MKNALSVRSLLPYRDSFFAPLEQQFDKFFNDFFQPQTFDAIRSTRGGYPKIDVVEDRDYLTIRAAVPGVHIDDLSVEILPAEAAKDNGSIGFPATPASVRISGNMSQEFKSDEGSYSYRELHKSRFSRVIDLPSYVTSDDPSTVLKDGVLTLKWKLKPEIEVENKTKKLKVSSG